MEHKKLELCMLFMTLDTWYLVSLAPPTIFFQGFIKIFEHIDIKKKKTIQYKLFHCQNFVHNNKKE